MFSVVFGTSSSSSSSCIPVSGIPYSASTNESALPMLCPNYQSVPRPSRIRRNLYALAEMVGVCPSALRSSPPSPSRPGPVPIPVRSDAPPPLPAIFPRTLPTRLGAQLMRAEYAIRRQVASPSWTRPPRARLPVGWRAVTSNGTTWWCVSINQSVCQSVIFTVT